MEDDDLTKLGFEYAWKWFEYHASQRTSMFNFFLIATGILANAYVGLLKEKLFTLAVWLGIMGALTSLAFLLLDCRNLGLVHMGEDILRELEKNSIIKCKTFNKRWALKKLKEIYNLGLYTEKVKKRLMSLLNINGTNAHYIKFGFELLSLRYYRFSYLRRFMPILIHKSMIVDNLHYVVVGN